jgi:hypothetical protein
MEAAEERGEHEAKDIAEELLLSSQAAFDLGDQVVGQAHVVEGLGEGLNIALGLAPLVLVTLLGMETTAFDGFGGFCGVSFAWCHGAFLRIGCW